MTVRRRWKGVATAAWLAAASVATAQMAPMTSREFPFPVDSGAVQNKLPAGQGQAAELVYWNEVRVHGAPWLRLKFDEAILAGLPDVDGSYLLITSLHDKAVQRLNARSIAEWSNTSAYFNGDAVRIELYAYPGTGLNRIRMSEVTGGTLEQGAQDTICGNIDNRTLSSYPANARIMPMGCTGWLITNGNCANRFLTAGHCFIPAPASAVVQFNVPLSTAAGTPVNPPPEHQYPVDMSSVQATQTVIGNDWSQFFTNANSNTGLHAREAQAGAAYVIGNAPAVAAPAQTFRVTGYGLTDPNDPTVSGTPGGLPFNQSQVQKTHTGPYTNLVGTRMEYQVDTTGGNSGSPIVNGLSPSSTAIGIHTNAGCNATAPINDNSGTAIQNAGLQAALGAPAGTCAPYAAPTCFETLFASDNGGDPGGAVYFDVQVSSTNDLEVTHLVQNMGSVGASFNVVVYLTPNTHVGKELNIGQWTQVATGSGASEAENTPSLIALSNRFTLKAGRRYGMAIRCNQLGHEYTNGTGANEVYENADLRITCGRAGNVAFTAPLIADQRVWNGRLCYIAHNASSSQCLQTIFATGNSGSSGGAVYFNANVSAGAPLIMTGLNLNAGSNAPPGTAFTVSVYTKAGGFAGFETNMAAWTLRTTGSGITAPVNSPTPVNFDSPFTLAAGSNNAFAVVMSAAANHAYTDGNGANQNYSNARLAIQTGSATNVPFTAGVFSPRVFNGSLCYYADVNHCATPADEQTPPNPDLGGFNSNAAAAPVSTQQVADDFSASSNTAINGARLWAVYTGNTFVPPTQSFTVNIFANSGGNPGALVYSANVPNVPVVDTGAVQVGFSPARPLYQFDLSFPNFNATAGTTYWLSPVGTSDTYTWCWQFVTNPVGGTLRARTNAAAPWTTFNNSVAFELCGAASCYPDCDGVGGLTANDFVCFLTAYNNGQPYANCDGIGGLTANDFICFLSAYNNGCP